MTIAGVPCCRPTVQFDGHHDGVVAGRPFREISPSLDSG
jgi:hypothetical protein